MASLNPPTRPTLILMMRAAPSSNAAQSIPRAPNGLIQADCGLKLLLQFRVKVKVVAPQWLLDHQQMEWFEFLQMRKVIEGVCRVGVAAQQNVRPATANLVQHVDIPAGLYLDLDALIARSQFSFYLLQQLLVRILNADADAAGDLAPRASEQLPQRNALLLRLGVPRSIFQCRLGHGMFAHTRYNPGISAPDAMLFPNSAGAR